MIAFSSPISLLYLWMVLLMASGLHGQDALQVVSSVQAAVISTIESCEKSVVAISRVRKDQVARLQFDTLRPGSLQVVDDPTSEDFVPTFFGSGVILSHDGFIVTCAHVLDNPQLYRYFVWLDRRCYPAQVVGLDAKPMASDPFSDLAVLKIEADDLQAIKLATQPVKKGQFVVGLGNPNALARDGQVSASWGIVANLNRWSPKENPGAAVENIHQLGTLIQTDLRLEMGSSGGALVNLQGELIGLTTTLVAARGNERPAGLAIAVDEFFLRVIETLKQGKQPEYGFLGIHPENLRTVEREQGLVGARIGLVIPGLPGSQAGLREGDVISQVGSSAIRSRSDLFRELSKAATGQKTVLLVQRRRGAGAIEQLNIEVELTKKFLATSRPSFSLYGPAIWRGAQVEYQSAIAGDLERVAEINQAHKVAFLNVAPDSLAWQAGARAGFGIIQVNAQSIQSPDQFHRLVAELEGEVTLTVRDPGGRQYQIMVPAESNPTP